MFSSHFGFYDNNAVAINNEIQENREKKIKNQKINTRHNLLFCNHIKKGDEQTAIISTKSTQEKSYDVFVTVALDHSGCLYTQHPLFFHEP